MIADKLDTRRCTRQFKSEQVVSVPQQPKTSKHVISGAWAVMATSEYLLRLSSVHFADVHEARLDA